MIRGMSIQGEKSKEADLVEALRKIKEGPATPTMKAVSVGFKLEAMDFWTRERLTHYNLDDPERTWRDIGRFKCLWLREDGSRCG